MSLVVPEEEGGGGGGGGQGEGQEGRREKGSTTSFKIPKIYLDRDFWDSTLSKGQLWVMDHLLNIN